MARKLEVQIVGDSASLERALGRAGKATNDVGSRFSGMAKMAVLGAGAAGVGALVIGLKGTVDAALDAEKASARFTDAMDKVGASAKQRAAAQQAISDLSRKAALDDEDLSDVYSKL